MRQEEKNRLSREKILAAATEEFGAKGYAAASLNTLLAEHGLSKGLVYHYFENKDRLYLGCVAACFDALTAALAGVEGDGSAPGTLHAYFEARGRFFQANPRLECLFFDALLQPPEHLKPELAEARAGFDALNRTLLRAVLNGVRLREGISEEEALAYFDLMQGALHLQLRATPERYEERARGLAEVLLFGLAGGERA